MTRVVTLLLVVISFAVLRSSVFAHPPKSISVDNAVPLRIGTVELFHLLDRQSGIIFVDARESDEMAEERLPRAINLPLRAVGSKASGSIARHDALIVPYCIKDFRGYEVARALQRQGYTNVRVMVDPGLKGWKAAKLPTAGSLPGRTDEQAMVDLKQRAAAYVAAHSATAGLSPP